VFPKRMFLTKGVGRHRDKLTSFEQALRNAGIAHLNIVKVSSIFPPECKLLSREQGLRDLSPGEITYAVLSENDTKEPHRLIAASVGVAIPKDRRQHGYLSEYCSFGENEQKAGDYAEDLAASMLATIIGVEFDPDASYDTKREIWKISGKIVRTTNITQSAIGDKRGLWTTVIAGAIFIC
jgi:arginine decarboxylase